jgi:hypothetical protein
VSLIGKVITSITYLPVFYGFLRKKDKEVLTLTENLKIYKYLGIEHPSTPTIVHSSDGFGSDHFLIPDPNIFFHPGSYMLSGMQDYFFYCFLCFQEQSLSLRHSQKDPGSGKCEGKLIQHLDRGLNKYRYQYRYRHDNNLEARKKLTVTKLCAFRLDKA